MGIDAEILLKIKGAPPTDADLKRWSWEVCNTLDTKKFFINRETGKGAFSLSTDYQDKGQDGKVWQQDGPDLIAELDETFVRANIWTRYYGIGYERGDILFICALAEWCEHNIPSVTVYYGGDSSGVLAEPFGRPERQKLLDHFFSPKGRDYFDYDSRSSIPSDGIAPNTESCKLCVADRRPRRYGWGQTYAAYFCGGCAQRFITKDGGETCDRQGRSSVRDLAKGAERPGTEMLYVGFLCPGNLLDAVRDYAIAHETSFSEAVRELLEEALTRPAYIKVVK